MVVEDAAGRRVALGLGPLQGRLAGVQLQADGVQLLLQQCLGPRLQQPPAEVGQAGFDVVDEFFETHGLSPSDLRRDVSRA